MRKKNKARSGFYVLAFMVLLVWAAGVRAQTTAFTYQGRLTDSGNPANDSYDLQFALFGSSSAGVQIGSTLTRSSVAVSGGGFSVSLDFGVNAFPGADRFLEIGVRTAGGGVFTILSPRQQISSSPYAIRTLSATTADALSSACAACVQDSHINSIAGSKVSGSIPVASVPGGSGSYIQNTATQQSGASFNISGSGTIGGALGVGTSPTAFGGSAVQIAAQDGLSITGGVPYLTFRDVNANNKRSIIQGDNGGLNFIPNSFVGNGQAMIVKDNGNVGIGTVTPTSKLEIAAQDGLRISGFQPFLTLNDTNSGKRSFMQAVNGDAVLLTNSRASMTLKDGTGDLSVIGNATQPPDKGGFVKAMLLVNSDGTINLCYDYRNPGQCGFTVSHAPSSGIYDINFGFQINSRFFSATMVLQPNFNLDSADEIYVRPTNTQTLRCVTYSTGVRANIDTGFYLLVF